MKIGIIGAGEIGGSLARRLYALGHEVSIPKLTRNRFSCGICRGNRRDPRDGRRGCA